jgi:seryl-tRNA synthetase
MRLPNILHESVPVGKDSSENVEVKRWGKPKRFSFELRSHGELAEALKVADFKRAAKISGTGFVYVKGALAMLDLALQRFAVDFLTRKGYLLIEPPLMMSRQAYEGVTDLADFENVMYKIEGENNYLIATSEHPMGAMYMNEVIEEAELPIRLCGISSCFRKEIGSHGVDTRGFFRMHQFNKVEQFVFCLPRDSWKMHEELQKNSEELYKKLRIPFRVVNICTGDIGTVASKKYDIEAWFPRDSNYAEVGSNSNCLSYQAVRLNIRYKKKTGEGEVKDYVHTLNNTAIATSRVMRAILENYQNKDGSVTVPEVLVKYMNGIKKIK